MATKKDLYDAIARLTEENFTLRSENTAFRDTLHSIYAKTRIVLGIEAAAEAREKEKTASKS